MRTQMVFEIDDSLTGDGLTVELDRKGNRLLISSRIDDAGERTMVVLDARRVGRELADALVLALAGIPTAPAPKARSTKTLRRAELKR